MRNCKMFGFAATSACLAVITLPTSAARADSSVATAPSIYQTINVGADDPTQFNNVPVAASNTADPNAVVDPIELQICNDSSKLYLQITYATSQNPQMGSGLYMGIDSDNNTNTGYHVSGSSNIGSNAAFENDYPFTQAGDTTNGVSENQIFNSGGTLTSASATAAGTGIYLATPYYVATTVQDISLPLDLTEVDSSMGAAGTMDTGPIGYNGLVFPQGQLFSLEFYTADPSSGDAVVLGTATYELADEPVTPEPSSLGLIGIAGVGLLRRRRRRCQPISA